MGVHPSEQGGSRAYINPIREGLHPQDLGDLSPDGSLGILSPARLGGSMEKRWLTSDYDVKTRAAELKEVANNLCKERNFEEAVKVYSEAIQLNPTARYQLIVRSISTELFSVSMFGASVSSVVGLNNGRRQMYESQQNSFQTIEFN